MARAWFEIMLGRPSSEAFADGRRYSREQVGKCWDEALTNIR